MLSAHLRPEKSMRPKFLLVLALSAILHPLPAQQPPETTPTLRTTTRNVILDVIVTDPTGNPVTGLTAADLLVTENGVPQHATVVDTSTSDATTSTTPAPNPPGNASQPTSPLPATSRPSGTRTVILLDEVNVQFFDLAFARKRLEVFLRSPAARGQSIAVLALTPTRQILVHDFSTDTETLVHAVHALPPVIPATGAGGPINGNVDSLHDMENLANAMAAIGQLGRAFSGSPERVNVIWITSGFLSLAPLVNGFEVQSTLDQILHQASNLFLSARIVLYTVDPHGVQSESNLPNHNSQPYQGTRSAQQAFQDTTGSQFAQQQLNMTANQAVANSFLGAIDQRSGGRAFGNGNDIDLALARIVGESNSSLRVVYSPSDKNFDGGYRKITVKLTRPGLSARTRDGYYALPEPPEPTLKEQRNRLAAALDSPFLYGALSVTGALTPASPTTPTSVDISIASSQIHWISSAADAHTDQLIALAAFSRDNHPLTSITYDVSARETTTAGGRPIQYHLRFTPPPGTARLRVAVSDKHLDQIGTAEIPLVRLSMPDSAAPFPITPLQPRAPATQP